MANLGDLIPSLSTSTPLSATGSFTSLPFLVTEYNSLSLTMFSDVNTTVVVSWSADSINFDYRQYYNYPAGTGTSNGVSVSNKWVKISIDNASLVASSVMRFTTYGSPTNSTTEVIIPPNINVEAFVRNSFSYSENGNLMVASNTPYASYQFLYGTGTTGGNFQPSYSGMTFGEFSKGSIPLFSFNVGNTGSFKLLDVGPIASQDFVRGNDSLAWMPGSSIECTFSAAFSQNKTKGSTGLGISTQWLGCGGFSTNIPAEGIFVGFQGSGTYNPITTPQTQSFGLYYWSNLNTNQFIPQQSWNIDNCSGFFKMPRITDWGAYNQFKIVLMQTGNIMFSILNPLTGLYTPCHYLNLTNLPNPAFQYPFFGFRMYQNSVAALATSDGSGISVNNWSICYQTNPVQTSAYYAPINNLTSLTATTDSLSSPTSYFAVVYAIYNPITWNLIPNFVTLHIDSISTGYQTLAYSSYLGLYKGLGLTGGTSVPIDYYNTPGLIYTTAPKTTRITTNSLFSAVVPYTTGSAYATHDLSKYDIRLFPGETLSVVLFTYHACTYVNLATSVGYHQIH